MVNKNVQIEGQERLYVLNKYDILDSLPEQEYDEITRLAATLCDTPIALVSLLDDHRQFFKSRYGTDIVETPIEFSFCETAIATPSKMTVVNDARLDSRFHENPLVTGDPNIVFYAGMPLISEEGKAIGTLCIIDTKPKNLSDEQIHSLRALANQVQNLLNLRIRNKNLKESRNQLKNYARSMEDFAFLAAHNLNNALSLVEQNLTLINLKYFEKWDDEDKMFINSLHSGSAKIKSLNDVLFDFVKIEHHKPSYSFTDINNLLDRLIPKLATEFSVLNPKVTYGNFAINLWPEEALEIIFRNLISNAFRFKSLATLPEITIEIEEQEEQWKFSVIDNGIGIPEHSQEIIFEPFKRLHHKSEYSGFGLGLTSCRKIIAKYDGKIWAESMEGIGSKFSFTISKPFIQTKPVSILMVEDNEGDILLTTEALQEGKLWNVINTVRDGQEAIDYLERRGKYVTADTPDIVLLDINLPKINGHEVLHHIKTNIVLNHIPVIMLSTSSSLNDVNSSYRNKACIFVTKPLEAGELDKILANLNHQWNRLINLSVKI